MFGWWPHTSEEDCQQLHPKPPFVCNTCNFAFQACAHRPLFTASSTAPDAPPPRSPPLITSDIPPLRLCWCCGCCCSSPLPASLPMATSLPFLHRQAMLALGGEPPTSRGSGRRCRPWRSQDRTGRARARRRARGPHRARRRHGRGPRRARGPHRARGPRHGHRARRGHLLGERAGERGVSSMPSDEPIERRGLNMTTRRGGHQGRESAEHQWTQTKRLNCNGRSHAAPLAARGNGSAESRRTAAAAEAASSLLLADDAEVEEILGGRRRLRLLGSLLLLLFLRSEEGRRERGGSVSARSRRLYVDRRRAGRLGLPMETLCRHRLSIPSPPL